MKHNRFSKWIERLLVLLPLFYVAISSAYVIFNKNAKDSYYGETINEYEVETINSYDSFISGETYYINTAVITTGTLNVSFNISRWEDFYDNRVFEGTLYITAYTTSGAYYLQVYRVDTTTVFLRGYTLSNNVLNASFVFDSLRATTNTDSFLNYFSYRVYNNYSYLNNVMIYSMSEFNKLGFGKLDFTSWFTNIFMNGNTNNVYVQFVNSYLNYFLMVECVYFIPMIIYWFIHFGESVVERFISKGDNW